MVLHVHYKAMKQEAICSVTEFKVSGATQKIRSVDLCEKLNNYK